MPKNSENLNRQLFDLLKSKGYDPTTLDTSGKETPVPEEAEVFQFNFTKDGEDYGKVTVSIDGLHKLIIYYGDDVANSSKSNDEELPSEGDSWYGLLRHLKKFAKNRQLSFELKNSNHLKHDMAKREYMKNKEKISEGYYPMGKKASYSDAVPNVKIVIEHTRQIEEGEQRYRNVNRIFLENQAGERFLLDTKQPGIARVYARHIAEGGKVNDERWGHINSLCEEYKKMSGFVRAVRNGQFNESAQQLVNEGINHYQSLRETLSKMTGHRGYNTYFESWTPALMEDEVDTTSLNELFVQETLDPRIESVMPILSKLHKQVAEMKEVGALAEWADSLLEGGDGGEASEEPVEPIDENSGLQALNPQGIPEGQLEEGHMSEVDSIIQDVINGELDAYDIMNRPKTPEEKYVADILQKEYEEVSMNHRLHPDDDFEEILDIVVDNLANDYGHPEDPNQVEEAERPGLWANIHAKRERIKHGSGEKMRKPGSKGAPTAQAFKDAAKEGTEQDALPLDMVDEPPADVDYDDEIDEGFSDSIKKGLKALDRIVTGGDKEDLLKDLKKKAGVHNPQTGKPSMAHSDVEKVNKEGVAEGFGSNYAEQLAQEVFNHNPNIKDENQVLNLGYNISKSDLGSRAQGIFRDEDFPSDFLSAYFYLQKQGVTENVDIGQEWMSDTELDQYVPDALEQEWRELVGYDANGNAHPLWINMTGEYEPKSSDPQHRAWMVKVANKWFAMKKIPNVKFFDVRDHDTEDELEWLVQIGKQGVAEGFEKFQVGDKISFPLSQMATGVVDKIDDKRLYVKLDNGEVYTIPSTMLHSVKLLERQGVAEGEFAGNYKTGPEGQWRNKGPKANKPAKVGDLVGASESFINTDTQAVVTEMDKSEDVRGPEGKATPIKADKAKKDFGRMFQKNIDKANKAKQATDEKVKQHQVKEEVDTGEADARKTTPSSKKEHDKVFAKHRERMKNLDKEDKKEVKEGQEDLDAILRIIRK